MGVEILKVKAQDNIDVNEETKIYSYGTNTFHKNYTNLLPRKTSIKIKVNQIYNLGKRKMCMKTEDLCIWTRCCQSPPLLGLVTFSIAKIEK